MAFNNDKKKKLADLLAKRRAAAAGEGSSTPIAPSTSTTSALQPINPAPAAIELGGVVVVESDDEDTCTGLVFKRPRAGETATPSASVSGGTPAFIDHPPSTSSPLQVVAIEDGGENVPEGRETPSTSQLPLLLQRLFDHFQDKEVVESLSGNFTQDRVFDGPGDFLVTSNLAVNRAQEAEDLKARMAKLEEEMSTQAKTFANHETPMYVEKDAMKFL